MDNLLKRLITQLDALIPFLALSHKVVFDLIKKEHGIWFSPEAEESLPNTYSIYQKQVSHAAFLLGYSYSEAFLADLIRQIYMCNPRMLPEEKQLKFIELRKVKSYKAVLKLMIDKEVTSVFAKNMEAVADYFGEKLSLKWPEEEKNKTIVASFIRNCIIHNLAIADSKLSEKSNYNVGGKIILSPSEVHSYGLVIRTLARNLYERAEKAFLKRNSNK